MLTLSWCYNGTLANYTGTVYSVRYQYKMKFSSCQNIYKCSYFDMPEELADCLHVRGHLTGSDWLEWQLRAKVNRFLWYKEVLAVKTEVPRVLCDI